MEYKPNIYPIIYWALLYGALSALALFVLKLLSDFITILWFPVFLAGLIWGGFRKYKQDKATWMQSQGVAVPQKSAMEEFKDAARDITQATQEMVTKQAIEDAALRQAQGEVQEVQIENTPQPEQAASQPTPITPQPSQEQAGEEIISQEQEK